MYGFAETCKYESKKKGKDQESIQSSTTPDPGYQWELTTSQLDITNEGQEVSPFQGINKQTCTGA